MGAAHSGCAKCCGDLNTPPKLVVPRNPRPSRQVPTVHSPPPHARLAKSHPRNKLAGAAVPAAAAALPAAEVSPTMATTAAHATIRRQSQRLFEPAAAQAAASAPDTVRGSPSAALLSPAAANSTEDEDVISLTPHSLSSFADGHETKLTESPKPGTSYPPRKKVTITVDPKSLGAGCYLQFTPVGRGVMRVLWSQTYPEGINLAFAKPAREVPAFKYKGEARRQDLVKGAQNDKKLYYSGWISFIKLAKSHEADFTLLDGINDVQQVNIVVLDSDCCLITLSPNTWYNFSSYRAAAVISGAADTFKGINNLDPGVFVQTGAKGGSSTSL